MTITSRQNPLVARFRDAARGDAGEVMLLDGPHLVADALAAQLRIVRAAEAAGATGVVSAGASANPFGWKALRGSMGSALRLPTFAAADAATALADARRRGCRIVATAPRGGTSIFALDLKGPVAVLIGGEGPGLPAALTDAADERVTIPMQAPVESLNAAVTEALIVYEAKRQRS